eukprot:1881452-Rhodomonas_salina.3
MDLRALALLSRVVLGSGSGDATGLEVASPVLSYALTVLCPVLIYFLVLPDGTVQTDATERGTPVFPRVPYLLSPYTAVQNAQLVHYLPTCILIALCVLILENLDSNARAGMEECLYRQVVLASRYDATAHMCTDISRLYQHNFVLAWTRLVRSLLLVIADGSEGSNPDKSNGSEKSNVLDNVQAAVPGHVMDAILAIARELWEAMRRAKISAADQVP